MAKTPSPGAASAVIIEQAEAYANAAQDSAVVKTLAALKTAVTETPIIETPVVTAPPAVTEPPKEAAVYRTVSFNSREGSFVPSQTVENGGKARKPAVNPTKEGYVFAGWFTDNTINAMYRFDNPITADRTLYAGWIALFTVSFDTRGGSAVPSQTVERGSTAAVPAVPSKEGVSFAGWYADSGLSARYNFDKIINGDITLYAKWSGASD
jgi:uncharacterized repeat protein (TIGR02543 family)